MVVCGFEYSYLPVHYLPLDLSVLHLGRLALAYQPFESVPDTDSSRPRRGTELSWSYTEAFWNPDLRRRMRLRRSVGQSDCIPRGIGQFSEILDRRIRGSVSDRRLASAHASGAHVIESEKGWAARIRQAG